MGREILRSIADLIYLPIKEYFKSNIASIKFLIHAIVKGKEF